jgi:type VI secretion system protein ImpA
MLDIEKLLQPISELSPSGENMAFSLAFDQIQEARQEESLDLELGDWEKNIKTADWQKVNQLAETLLLEKTKDIRVAGWLLEGQVKTQGFQGLADGLSLLNGLCERFWETLHPQIEDDDPYPRLGGLTWIANQASELSRYIPLTQRAGENYGLAFWESANHLEQAIRRSPSEANSLSSGRITLEDIQQAKSKTPAKFFHAAHESVSASQQALAALDQTLQRLLGDEAPSWSKLAEILTSISELISRFAKETGVVLGRAAPQQEKEKLSHTEAIERIEPSMSPTNAVDIQEEHITSRKQALKQLRSIARFFHSTEPHSPVGYLLQKAADWGEMPLHEWLRQVIKNPDSLNNLQEQLGIKNQEE